MAPQTPAQKRVFHLVYARSRFSGGVALDEADHIKNRVLAFASDLLRLTREFEAQLMGVERELVNSALQRSLIDGAALARQYEIPNPLSELAETR